MGQGNETNLFLGLILFGKSFHDFLLLSLLSLLTTLPSLPGLGATSLCLVAAGWKDKHILALFFTAKYNHVLSFITAMEYFSSFQLNVEKDNSTTAEGCHDTYCGLHTYDKSFLRALSALSLCMCSIKMRLFLNTLPFALRYKLWYLKEKQMLTIHLCIKHSNCTSTKLLRKWILPNLQW